MQQLFGIAAPATRYKPGKPWRSPAYRRFVRGHCCALCGSWRGVECAHSGPHGISEKADDRTGVPLCRRCHRTGPASYHKLGRRFFLTHGLDVERITGELQSQFFRGRRAA